MNIVSRQQWGARPERSRQTIALPTPDVWLHHTADSSRGAAGVRAIQTYHMDTRGWSDIAYSFLVDPDGTIYEGRGPGVSGAHTAGHNKTSHAIAAMGNYQDTQPSDVMLDAIAALVRHGHTSGWWPQVLSGGHRDVGSTSCPGRYLYARIDAINAQATAPTHPEDDMKTHLEKGDSGGQVVDWMTDLVIACLKRGVNLGGLDVGGDISDAVYTGASAAAVNRYRAAVGLPETGIYDYSVLGPVRTDLAGRPNGGEGMSEAEVAAAFAVHRDEGHPQHLSRGVNVTLT